MATKGKQNVVGGWVFLIGILIAVLFGLLGTLNSTLISILVVIGLVIGFLNVTAKEITSFLLAGLVLVVVLDLGGNVMGSVVFVGNILDALMALIVPATVIVALKAMWNLARS